MRVSKQAITRWLKKLFGSNLPRQLEAKNAEIPPPSFEIGDPVKIIGTKKNSARSGRIREHIWHHRNTEWMYFTNEEGRKVSKRYREDELEPDHENLPVGPLSDVITKRLTPSGSLVEAYELFLEIEFTEQERKQIVNPLGTEFDLVNVFVGRSKEQLECSPFLHSWTNEVFEKFSGKKGIWLSVNSENLFLEFADAEKHVSLDTDWALFFPILDQLKNKTQSIRLVITCMN